jgi:hypothetical protein
MADQQRLAPFMRVVHYFTLAQGSPPKVMLLAKDGVWPRFHLHLEKLGIVPQA